MFAGLLEVCVWRVWAGTTSGRGAHFKSETLAAVFARREGIDRVGGLNPLRWAFSQLASQQFSRATQACITAGAEGWWDSSPLTVKMKGGRRGQHVSGPVLFYALGFDLSVSINVCGFFSKSAGAWEGDEASDSTRTIQPDNYHLTYCDKPRRRH